MLHTRAKFSHLLELLGPREVLAIGVLIVVVLTGSEFAKTWHRSERLRAEIYRQDFDFLTKLNAAQIEMLEIDGLCTFPKASIAAFVSAANQIEEFMPNHDLGKTVGTLRITMTSGEVHAFDLIRRQPKGLVIQFYREQINRVGGTVTSAKLTQVLEDVCGAWVNG